MRVSGLNCGFMPDTCENTHNALCYSQVPNASAKRLMEQTNKQTFCVFFVFGGGGGGGEKGLCIRFLGTETLSKTNDRNFLNVNHHPCV